MRAVLDAWRENKISIAPARGALKRIFPLMVTAGRQEAKGKNEREGEGRTAPTTALRGKRSRDCKEEEEEERHQKGEREAEEDGDEREERRLIENEEEEGKRRQNPTTLSNDRDKKEGKLENEKRLPITEQDTSSSSFSSSCSFSSNSSSLYSFFPFYPGVQCLWLKIHSSSAPSFASSSSSSSSPSVSFSNAL